MIGEDGGDRRELGWRSDPQRPCALLDHYGAAPRACQPYRAKTTARSSACSDTSVRTFSSAGHSEPGDLNAQFDIWRTEIANPRVHATTDRVVDEAFAEERHALKPLPVIPYSAVLTIERRVSKEGVIRSVATTIPFPTPRAAVPEVQHHVTELRISRTALRSPVIL